MTRAGRTLRRLGSHRHGVSVIAVAAAAMLAATVLVVTLARALAAGRGAFVPALALAALPAATLLAFLPLRALPPWREPTRSAGALALVLFTQMTLSARSLAIAALALVAGSVPALVTGAGWGAAEIGLALLPASKGDRLYAVVAGVVLAACALMAGTAFSNR